MNIFKKQKGTGALADTRPLSEVAKDYHLSEIVSSVSEVLWEEKKEWNTYPIYNQNGSGSCVAQTVSKMLGIMYGQKFGTYIPFSATHVYQRRSNAPSGGMIGNDAGNIARKGVTLESLVNSQDMTDKEMDAVPIEEYKKKVGEVFKADTFVQLKTKSIDDIASTIQKTGKPVMVWYYFNHDEWTETPKIKRYVQPYSPSTSRHSVTAVDFILIKGKKHLVIDDSWGTRYGKRGQRFISEEFHNTRNFYAMYFTKFDFEATDPDYVPVTKFIGPFVFGKRNGSTVVLQNFLKLRGFFPNNVESTGYFGSITKRSVIKFQLSRGLVGDGIVGPKTLKELNK